MVASLVYHRLSLWVEITGCGRSLSGIHGDGVGLTEPAFVWQVVLLLKQRDVLLLLLTYVTRGITITTPTALYQHHHPALTKAGRRLD